VEISRLWLRKRNRYVSLATEKKRRKKKVASKDGLGGWGNVIVTFPQPPKKKKVASKDGLGGWGNVIVTFPQPPKKKKEKRKKSHRKWVGWLGRRNRYVSLATSLKKVTSEDGATSVLAKKKKERESHIGRWSHGRVGG
jgi:hypothetical protein